MNTNVVNIEESRSNIIQDAWSLIGDLINKTPPSFGNEPLIQLLHQTWPGNWSWHCKNSVIISGFPFPKIRIPKGCWLRLSEVLSVARYYDRIRECLKMIQIVELILFQAFWLYHFIPLLFVYYWDAYVQMNWHRSAQLR